MTEWNAFDWQKDKNLSDDDNGGDTLVKLTDVKIFAEECVNLSVSRSQPGLLHTVTNNHGGLY